MNARLSAILVGVVAASAPALAKESHVRAAAPRVALHAVAAKPAAARQPRIAALPAAAGTAGPGRRHKAGKAAQKAIKDKEGDGAPAATERDPAAVPANFPVDAVGWRLIADPATGVRLGVPEKLVPRADTAHTGSRWASAQGQIQIETFRLTEAALPALFDEQKKASHRQIESSTLKPESFIITGVQGLKNFVVRADAHGGEVRGVTVLYDQATAGIMGRVARAVANSFAGFPDPNAAPLPGMRRAVEYGTAIVVSGDGDLIASGAVTDGCQTITVPGLGHAERVAEDKADDLALLRLYGARNLIPAAVGGEGAEGDDLILVGVADPLAQAGGGTVTSSAARSAGQAIAPAPKPGFSGAAALDAGGRFAGIVDLNGSLVAGSGAAGPAATLVPAAAVRGFLDEHHIMMPQAAANGRAFDQSVLRVICVRK